MSGLRLATACNQVRSVPIRLQNPAMRMRGEVQAPVLTLDDGYEQVEFSFDSPGDLGRFLEEISILCGALAQGKT